MYCKREGDHQVFGKIETHQINFSAKPKTTTVKHAVVHINCALFSDHVYHIDDAEDEVCFVFCFFWLAFLAFVSFWSLMI